MRIDSQGKTQSAQRRKKGIAAKGWRRRDADGNHRLKGRIEVPEIRQAKVDSLQRAVQSGEHRVSSEQIAGAMFQQMLMRSIR